MMSNMASSLIMHKRIRTTLAKAKALRIYVEPLITRSKEDTTHNRREVFSYLQDNKAVTELFRVVSQKVADRPGGYTRILKMENRLGDNAQMCFIELVDFNDFYVTDAAQKKGAKRTRRGATKKSEAGEVAVKAPVAAAIAPETAPVVEEVEVEETPDALAEADDTPADDAPAEETDKQNV
jgi:large subunit ribosomal protein L17